MLIGLNHLSCGSATESVVDLSSTEQLSSLVVAQTLDSELRDGDGQDFLLDEPL